MKVNIQSLTLKANAQSLTDADMASIKSAGLVLKHTRGTSFEDVLERQAMRRQNNVVRGY